MTVPYMQVCLYDTCGMLVSFLGPEISRVHMFFERCVLGGVDLCVAKVLCKHK